MRKISAKATFGRIQREMIRSVISFCLSAGNLAVTSTIAAFLSLINRLKVNLDAIDNLEKLASDPVNGKAAQKLQLKNALIEMSNAIMQTVYSMASETNNDNVKDQMRTSASKMRDMSYEKLVDYTGQAIINVTAVLPSLVDYNITAATMTLWQQNVTNLHTVLSNPKAAHKHIDTIKKDAQALYRQCMNMLYNEADTLAMQFKKDHLSYYTEYRAMRKLQPLTQHTKLKVSITNELKEPMFNVQVLQNNKDNKAFTDIKGECTLYIKVNEGPDEQPVYTFTIGTGPHAIQSGDIEIKKGHTQSRSFIMAPSGFIIPAPVSENENQPA